MKGKETSVRLVSVVLCEVVALFTVAAMLETGWSSRLLLALATVGLLLLPMAMERLLRCRFWMPVYLFCLAYALCAMMGQCWNAYYLIPWWDKMLHICGGVLFTILGVCLLRWIAPENKHLAAAALFGLLFSMAVAVLWEFVEFGMDSLLETDMQNDTVITGFSSYLLGDTIGKTASIGNITSVLVNGVPLPVQGYLDIGLTDTMVDMLVETIGAILTCLLFLLDRGRHPPVTFERE